MLSMFNIMTEEVDEDSFITRGLKRVAKEFKDTQARKSEENIKAEEALAKKKPGYIAKELKKTKEFFADKPSKKPLIAAATAAGLAAGTAAALKNKDKFKKMFKKKK